MLRRFWLLALFTIVGCSGGFPGVFQIDVAQGNILTQSMLDQVKPGLEKQQVLYLLGTPLVKDAFNQDRWDYLYYFAAGDEPAKTYRVALFFESNRLISVVPLSGQIKAWHQASDE